MREIMFRGYDEYYKRWKYGYYVCENVEDSDSGDIEDICYIVGRNVEICYDEVYPLIKVDCKSVGQYTGLKDKNGKEIYEGDILKFEEINRIGVVEYDDEFAEFFIRLDRKGERYMNFMFAVSGGFDFKVIGNIYENPEEVNKNVL